MRIRYGAGGWVSVRDIGLGGVLYVRFQKVASEWQIGELYLDGRGQMLTGATLRALPLGQIGAAGRETTDLLEAGMDEPAVDLSTLASYFATSVAQVNNWVDASLASQLPQWIPPDGFSKRVRRRPDPRGSESPKDVRLTPDDHLDGLTDDFLRRVADAFATAIRHDESPARSLAEQALVSPRTVHSWVYKARQRGLMERGKKGRIT